MVFNYGVLVLVFCLFLVMQFVLVNEDDHL